MEPPEGTFVEALIRRVRLAVADAQRQVGQARRLVELCRIADGEIIVRRCAWCGRLSVGGEWTAPESLQGFVPPQAVDNATHSICPDCTDRLEHEGRSHADPRR
ncbi:MAG TPA: hypothetical protein VE088_05425 [Gaiellaceae bacterium]|nr:hypothetical protein [Gaiellaceae bacterium]